MKRSNKAISGILAGAAIGVLTFMYVKPKIGSKKKETTNQSSDILAISKSNPENLFI